MFDTKPLLRELWATAIHPETGMKINTGKLPAGTLIINAVDRLHDAFDYCCDTIRVRVIANNGFMGIEEMDPNDLLEALVDPLPVDDAPSTVEPVTVSGVYELRDGTVGYIVVIPAPGQSKMIARTVSEHGWSLGFIK
jgi:hypothetical protein